MDEMKSAVQRIGTVEVRTAAGTIYVIDWNRMCLSRTAAATPSAQEGLESVSLRRDGGWIKILEVLHLEIGERAVLVLEPLGDPRSVVYTTRTTTPVLWIRTVGAAA